MIALTRDLVEQAYAQSYLRADELPKYVLDGIHPIDADIDLPDYAGVLRKGWKWAFEYMAKGQPRTYAEIEKLSPALEFREFFIESGGDRRWWGDLLLKLGDRYVPLFPYFARETFEERAADGEEDEFVSSLPPAIGMAHYGRIAGMAVVNENPLHADGLLAVLATPCRSGSGPGRFFDRERFSGVAAAVKHLRRVATVGAQIRG